MPTRPDVDLVPREVPEPAGGHLRPTRVVHAEEEDRRNPDRTHAIDAGERVEPLPCELLGEQRQERPDLGRCEQTLEGVKDEPFDRLGAERSGEIAFDVGARRADQ